MLGFICDDLKQEWWVRRKEPKKSKIVISREQYKLMNGTKLITRITEYEIDYALSSYCDCPKEVKDTAKLIKESVNPS